MTYLLMSINRTFIVDTVPYTFDELVVWDLVEYAVWGQTDEIVGWHDLEWFDVWHCNDYFWVPIILRQLCFNVTKGSTHTEPTRSDSWWSYYVLSWFIIVALPQQLCVLVYFASILLNTLDLTAFSWFMIDWQWVSFLPCLSRKHSSWISYICDVAHITNN